MLDDLIATIRDRRKFLALTQAEVAQAAGVARTTLAAFEGGRFSDLGIRKVDRICQALGLHPIVVAQRRPTLPDLVVENEKERHG